MLHNKLIKTLSLCLLLSQQLTACSSGNNDNAVEQQSDITAEKSIEEKNTSETPEATSTNPSNKMNSEAQESIYDGLYVSSGTYPRLYVLSKGKFYMYKKKMNDDLPTGHFYDRDLVSTFKVENDQLVSPDYDFGAHFIKTGDQVTAMEDRFVKTKKAESLKTIFAMNEWDAKPLLGYLISNEGLNRDDAKNTFVRTDLWRSIAEADFGSKTKITLKELALSFSDPSFTKIEKATGDNPYDGVYGYINNSGHNISRLMVVKKSRILWYDVFWEKTGYTNTALILRHVSNIDSEKPVSIIDGKYAYNREREYGQFIIKDGEVTGVKAGTVELMKYHTLAEMIKMNPAMDAREVLSMLIDSGLEADGVKSVITEKSFIELFDYDKLGSYATLSDLISEAS